MVVYGAHDVGTSVYELSLKLKKKNIRVLQKNDLVYQKRKKMHVTIKSPKKINDLFSIKTTTFCFVYINIGARLTTQ